MENILPSVELDKLSEIGDEILWELNILLYRIFLKYSLHRPEKCLKPSST